MHRVVNGVGSYLKDRLRQNLLQESQYFSLTYRRHKGVNVGDERKQENNGRKE